MESWHTGYHCQNDQEKGVNPEVTALRNHKGQKENQFTGKTILHWPMITSGTTWG